MIHAPWRWSVEGKCWLKHRLAAWYWGPRGPGRKRVRRQGLLVVAFHRITTPEAFETGLWSLVNGSPEVFEAMVNFLKDHVTIVSLATLRQALDGRVSLPPGSLLLTFDDGYRDFVTFVAPILKRHRLPAVVFPTTAGLGELKRLLWIDRLALTVDRNLRTESVGEGVPAVHDWRREARKQQLIKAGLKAQSHPAAATAVDWHDGGCGEQEIASRLYLSAEDLRMLDPSIAIGSHGISHRLLTGLSGQEVVRELAESKAVLEAAVGRPIEAFAYPVGRSSDIPREAETLLAQCGYTMGFTMECGHNRLDSAKNRYRLRRVHAGTSLADLQFNMLKALEACPQ
ncbi:MAG: polysaccharide deacetylase family protein [Candidatus Omnitrophota bacterium]|nr:polysaccharide deacetylase family protein [Candidatus Omnitrophota bacterium]